jgi:hypothetical protein
MMEGRDSDDALQVKLRLQTGYSTGGIRWALATTFKFEYRRTGPRRKVRRRGRIKYEETKKGMAETKENLTEAEPCEPGTLYRLQSICLIPHAIPPTLISNSLAFGLEKAPSRDIQPCQTKHHPFINTCSVIQEAGHP